jgi:hypothetical protein
MGGQRPAAASRTAWESSSLLSLRPWQRLFDILERQAELVRIELLALATKLHPLQLLQQMFQPVEMSDEAVAFGKHGIALGENGIALGKGIELFGPFRLDRRNRLVALVHRLQRKGA